MLNDIMNGDPEVFIQTGLATKRAADEALERAREEDKEAGDVLNRRLETIEEASKKERHHETK